MSKNTNWVSSLRPDFEKEDFLHYFTELVGGQWRIESTLDWGSPNVFECSSEEQPFGVIVGKHIAVFISGHCWSTFYGFEESREAILLEAQKLANALGDGRLLICSEQACVMGLLMEEGCDEVTLSDVKMYLEKKYGEPQNSFQEIQTLSDTDTLAHDDFYFYLEPQEVSSLPRGAT